jgi:peptide methionine sulfoxide reductase MsrB
MNNMFLLKDKSFRYLSNIDDFSKININDDKYKILSTLFDDYNLKNINTKCRCKYCDSKINHILISKINTETLCMYCSNCNNIFK